jgi:predicted dehydrogenase
MVVNFSWGNVEKTTIRFTVSGGWNWNDLHKNLARSSLWLDQVGHEVDLLIDLRGQPLPSGAVGHLRSLGKTQHRNASGRVIIIGVPDATIRAITHADDKTYRADNRLIVFVEDQDAASAVLANWQSSQPRNAEADDPSGGQQT